MEKPLKVDFNTLTLEKFSELIQILQENGGFYYDGKSLSIEQLQFAVDKRLEKGGVEWSFLYETNIKSEYNYASFIPDLEIFDIVESLDWPYMPMISLSFEKVIKKYNLLQFILRYKLHMRKSLEEKYVRTCVKTHENRILGIQYDDVICDTDLMYIDIKLPKGQFTYVIAIVNNKISIAYKQYIHALEIGSKHLCIVKKLISMDPNVKFIIAGEIVSTEDEIKYNMISGTITKNVIVQTLDTIINSTWPTWREEIGSKDENNLPIIGSDNSNKSWWIPLLKYLFKNGKYIDKSLFIPINILSSKSLNQLCDTESKNMYEFGSLSMCNEWSLRGELFYARDYCSSRNDIKEYIGKRIIETLSKESKIIRSAEDIIVFANGLSITSTVLAFGGYSTILKGKLSNLDIIAKIAIYYSDKEALQSESNILSRLRTVPNLLLPLIYFISYIGGVNYMIFPYYNRGNLLNYCNYIQIFSQTFENKVEFSKIIAKNIIPALLGMHKEGYLHLDISFGNILVNESNIIQMTLTDVGMAREINEFKDKWSSLSKKNIGGGTDYSSVAIVTDLELNEGSDFESLGYLLYDLVYGNLPWQGLSEIDAAPLKLDFDPKIFTEYFNNVKINNYDELLSKLYEIVF